MGSVMFVMKEMNGASARYYTASAQLDFLSGVLLSWLPVKILDPTNSSVGMSSHLV